MASYLDRLYTLDEEEGMDLIDSDFEAEQTQDVTEVIDADTNSDEINEEAASIEEDIEAMQEGSEAVNDLADQESANEELLESPQDITPEVAKVSNDAFKVTLAKLKIDVRDTTYGRITYDSNNNEPIQVVRITNDGVKDFLHKIKEHIMAFFRAIKRKIQKLIAKLFIMFSDVSKKAEALQKKIHNKLNKLSNTSIDVSSHEVKSKIGRALPLPLLANNGDLNTAISNIEKVFGSSISEPIVTKASGTFLLDLIKTGVEKIATSNGVPDSVINSIKNGYDKCIKPYENIISYNKYYNALDVDEPNIKTDWISKTPLLVSGFFSNKTRVMYFYITEDAEYPIPHAKYVTATIKQTQVDNLNISGITANNVQDYIKTCIKISKNSKPMCQGAYKHLEDTEKEVTNLLKAIEKEEEIKHGGVVKIISLIKTVLSSVTFYSVIEQAKAPRKLLSICNMLYDMLEDKKKEDKATDKRNKKYS